jgi:hypothetical protein
MTPEMIQLLIAVLLGTGSGSIAGFIVAITTIRYERRKRAAEAKEAEQRNDESLVSAFHKFIVEPLTKETDGLRKDIRRFTRAIEKSKECPYAANCPIIHELQNGQECREDCPMRAEGAKK